MRLLPSFSLHRPRTLREALELLRDLDEAKPFAGGTDLLLDLREGVCQAKHLVDLGRVEELRYIREADGKIRIGAMTTYTQLLRSELIAANVPVLREAAACVGSVQTRNMGTIGGNLCNASPGADTAPPLLIIDAELTIASLEGSRSIPLSGLFAGPKMNSLRPGELLTEIRFPIPPAGSGASFHKLGRRRGYTLSLINAAAYLEVGSDVCREARLAIGACAPTPIRMSTLEEMLRGKRLYRRLIEEAASACHGLVKPSTRAHARASVDYRRAMSCVLTRRALMDAWERARGNLR